ncbi:hypothetical protein ACF09H_27910 [Streptomyces sp. NPDC014983]|uniref:hypothetical protein n=1 Tax=Streptomyces sp. NPDC014983 TaxID=3364933 RepID=UPI0036FE8930
MDTISRPGLLARAAGAAAPGPSGAHRADRPAPPGRFPVGRLVTTFSSRTSNEAVSGVRDGGASKPVLTFD